MKKSSLSRLVIVALVLALVAPMAVAAPAPSTDGTGEPSVVSLVLGWWSSLWDAVGPSSDPVGAPADGHDEVSPMSDPVGPPADLSSGDEASPQLDPVDSP